MEQNLKTGGSKNSVTPSMRLQNQKLGTLSAPMMLQQSNIVLLRQSKQEIALKLAQHSK